jgi:hypothetical protein
LDYIYFKQGIGPSLILQDKNLTNIYFELPEKELNHKLCFQKVVNTVKIGLQRYTIGKLLDFYWWRTLEIWPAEVYPLRYESIDLSTDPGLKSHLITFPC